MIIPVILAGGSGTRLWPLSRQSHPKQFLYLVDEQYTMLQLTLKRLDNLSKQILSPIIVCHENHRFIVAEQLRQIGIEHASIILEPCAKNTAPAITLAALQAQELYPNQEVHLLVLSADNYIADVSNFQQCILVAEQQAPLEKLVTFGVKPTEPHTGYGYIQLGDNIADKHIYQLKKFVEKPDLQTAEYYLSSQNYLWNSGMFMFQSQLFLQELEQYRAEIYQRCLNAWQYKTKDLDFIRIDLHQFQQCPEDSIDYAIMERTTQGVVVCIDVGWNDLGSWSSLWQSNQKDELSLQLHHHRAEHWVVVKGTAKVTKGEEHYYVSENESTFIPLGTVHSLENPGCIPLELIEIQSGGYLGEDDIVRLKDDYGRI